MLVEDLGSVDHPGDEHRRILGVRLVDLDDAIGGSLPAKVHQIQENLPAWIQSHPDRQSEVEPLLHQLDDALKAGRLQDAQAAADAILALIEGLP